MRCGLVLLTLAFGYIGSPRDISIRAASEARSAGPPGSVEFAVAYRAAVARSAGDHHFAALPPRPIELDQLFRRNLTEAIQRNIEISIYNGTPVSNREYDSTVAILRKGDVWCSGVAIGRRKVITAGHCLADATAVAEGNEITGTTGIPVIGRARFDRADVGILFLGHDLATRRFARLAKTSRIDRASVLRVVGYGSDTQGMVGIKAFGDVAIATLRCDGPGDPKRWGCQAPFELVADDKVHHVDTCHRDSGGPAFVGKGRSRRVAAIVKSSVTPGRNCIDGSIYTRADTAGLADFLKKATPEAAPRISLR